MDRTFRARVTVGQYVALPLCTVMAGYGLWYKEWLVAVVFMLLLVVLIEQVIHSAYTVTAGGQLVVSRGRFRRQQRVALPDILSVERVKAPLLGALLVSHYVLVSCKGGKNLALLPADEAGFVRLLQARMQKAGKG